MSASVDLSSVNILTDVCILSFWVARLSHVPTMKLLVRLKLCWSEECASYLLNWHKLKLSTYKNEKTDLHVWYGDFNFVAILNVNNGRLCRVDGRRFEVICNQRK